LKNSLTDSCSIIPFLDLLSEEEPIEAETVDYNNRLYGDLFALSDDDEFDFNENNEPSGEQFYEEIDHGLIPPQIHTEFEESLVEEVEPENLDLEEEDVPIQPQSSIQIPETQNNKKSKQNEHSKRKHSTP